MLQVSDAQAGIVPGLRWNGQSLRNVQERSLGRACCADIDPKDSPEPAPVSCDIAKGKGCLHMPKTMCELQADLALSLATNPR